MKEFTAHISDDGRKQSVEEHLTGTSELAKSFALGDFKEFARYAAAFHDIGKYRDIFQKKINGDKNIRCEHACFGAQEIIENGKKAKEETGNSFFEKFAYMLACCVSGHHTGLQDGGTDADTGENATLSAALKRKDDDFKKFEDKFPHDFPDITNLFDILTTGTSSLSKKTGMAEVTERFSFFTRYIFSCLTDADFIDTESFFNPNAQRGVSGDFSSALEKLNEHMSNFTADTEVKKARKALQEQAFNNYDGSQISILNMPTGSGKTLCSMKLALKRAVEAGKKRIIYVIPYTSIIEQTANTFENIFKDDLPVLQHHSNYSFENLDSKDEDNSTSEKLRKTCENWDAPLIITTNVQFFESLYHIKGSRLRKLHNLADSIIIFDEVHMIPVNYLQPCLRAIGYVTYFLNSEAILLSATMPDYNKYFSKFVLLGEQKELITDKSMFKNFSNCEYKYLGECSSEKIISISENHKSNLIIVNRKKEARRIYDMLEGKKFHLSTYMTAVHRSEVIAQIRKCLADKESNERITVVSTSLIEAGVDLDFEAVFREISGVDSILQSAGRCNREGKREAGYMYIFENADTELIDEQKTKASISRPLLKNNVDITSPESIKRYYDEWLASNEKSIEKNSIARNPTAKISSIPYIQFKEYADSFDFISNETIGIIIPCEENKKHIESLKNGCMSVRRQLQKYCANVSKYEFDTMYKLGLISDNDTGVFCLSVPENYNSETGLDIKHQEELIF